MTINRQNESEESAEEEPSETVFTLLLSIENRLTTIENSMKWFKSISRVAVVIVFGFFGLDMGGIV